MNGTKKKWIAYAEVVDKQPIDAAKDDVIAAKAHYCP
ncbi:MAG: hypothetical protein JWL63_2164 [Rhodocyclales bacterium]|nr:hypothetical protein [Rhodocyclales bacterium]